MNKKWQSPVRRTLALLLCVAFLVGMFPGIRLTAKAVEDTDTGLLWLDGKIDASTPLRTKAYLDYYSPYGYGDSIVSGSKLLIRNPASGYVMSFNPERSNATSYTGSISMDQSGESLGTYYEVTGSTEGGVSSGQLYVDPSARNDVLWIIRQMVDSQGNKLANEQSKDGQNLLSYTGNFVDVAPSFGGRIIPGVHLQKGSISGHTEGYWFSDGVNNDGAMFRHLCFRVASASSRPFTSTSFFNEQTKEANTPRAYLIEMLSDGRCIIYFKMSPTDLRVLHCDGNGVWNVKRYRADETTGQTESSVTAAVLADQGNLHRIYGYNSTSSSRKNLSYKGYTQYNLSKGIDKAEVLEIISENLTVFDPDHRDLQVPYQSDDGSLSGNGKAGFYRLQLPSGFNTGKTGNYTVNIVYNCLEGNSSFSKSVIGSVNVNILTGSASITNTSGVVTRNASDSFPVYPNENSTTPASFTFTAGNREAQVPITLEMIRTSSGQRVDTSKPGRYTNLVLKYNGVVVTSRYTLTVSETTLKADLPVYPAPGAVDVNKVATTSQDDFFKNSNGPGVTDIQLSLKGKNSTKGVDLIIIMDLSSSMRYAVDGNVEVADNNTDTENWPKTRLYKMEQALKAMIGQMQDDNMDIRIAMADFGDLDHFEFENAVIDKAHRTWPQIEMVGGQAGAEYSGNATSSKFFAVNYNTEIANHLNFILGKGDKEIGATIGLTGGQGISQAFYLHPYKYDSNMASGFTGKILPKVYTGSEKVDADAFVDVNTLNDASMEYIIRAIDDQNQNMLGTNYDVGLEYAYRLAYARQQANIAKGDDRMVTCIFMSDGAAMQYNYFSGRAHSESWSQYLGGNTDEILTNNELAAKWDLGDFNSLHPDLKWVIERLRQMMHNGQLWFVAHGDGHNPNGSSAGSIGHACPNGTKYAGRAAYWPGPAGCTCGAGTDNGMHVDFPGAFYGHNSGYQMDWYDLLELIYENRANPAMYAAPNPIGTTVVSNNQTSTTVLDYQLLIQRLREPGYVTGYGHATGSTNDWSVDDNGNVISGINTFYNNRFQYQTYSPYWYFYNTEGKNWWAEAIKGDSDKVYPVVNRHAGKNSAEWKGDLYTGEVSNRFNGNTAPEYMRGKEYISGFKGLGMDIYTVGFAITADDNMISAVEAKTVLQTVATRPAMFYDTNDTSNLTAALQSIIASATSSASSSWFTDTIGGPYDLLTSDNAWGKGVTPTITLKEYAVNADGSRGELIKTWETITFGDKGVAYLNGNKSVDIWGNDGGIRGEYLYFNTNTTGSIYLENIRNTGMNYTLPAETFFWAVGSVTETELVMEYQVYLLGSTENELSNVETSYETNKEAIFHYRDELGNMVAHETVSPERSWYETADYTVGIYLVDENGTPLTANGTTTSGISNALKLGSQNVKFNTPDGPTYNGVTAQDIFEALNLDPNLYEIFTPSTEVLITSDRNTQNHDVDITDSGSKKTTYVGQGQVDKNNLNNSGLSSNHIYFAVKLKDFNTAVHYGIYLVDSKGKPILADGTPASGPVAAALGSSSMDFTVESDTSVTTLTVEQAMTNLGLNGQNYLIYSPGSQVSITSNKQDRTHRMAITDTTNPKTTMIGTSTSNPSGALSDSQLIGNKIWFAVELAPYSAQVNYGIYLVDKDGNPIKTDGTDATNPGDAVLKDGNLTINVIDDITNTTLTVEEAMDKLGLDKNIYEIVSVGSKVDITSNKATGLHDVDITDPANPKTTFVGDDTNNKDDLSSDQLANNDVLFAVRLKDYDVSVNYGVYLVDSKGNPIKADGSSASGPAAAALGSGAFQFTVDDHNTVSGITVDEAMEKLGLSKDTYEIFSPGTQVSITAEKFDRTYEMEITDTTVPNTTMIGNSTEAPQDPLNGSQLADSKIWFAVKLPDFSAKVNYGIYLVDKDGNPIKTDGTDASDPADAVLGNGNLNIDVSEDITNTTLTVENALKDLGLDEDIYEIVSVGSQVDITTNKTTGLHDVQITDNTNPKTTFVGDDTNNKDDLDNDELADNEVLFAVRLKDYDVSVNYGVYLVDTKGNPILTDGTAASGPAAAALGSGAFQFTVDDHNTVSGITVEEAMRLLGLSEDAYKIFSPGTQVSITAEKFDRTYEMVISDGTEPKTTMIGTSTEAPQGPLDGSQLADSKIWFAVKLPDFTAEVNYGIYLVDKDGNPIKTDGTDASNPGDAVLKDGNLIIDVIDDITNTNLTVDEAMDKLGLDKDIYEIVSVGSQVDITTNKATGLHDVEITDNFDPKTTFVGDDTNNKDDLDSDELADHDVLFAVRLKDYDVSVNYGIYLVDSNGNPILTDGTAASGPDAAALNSGAFQFTVDEHNTVTGITVEEAMELLGLSGAAYEIFSPGTQVSITAEKFDRTYEMVISDGTEPKTTLIGTSTEAPQGPLDGDQLADSKIWFAVKLKPFTAVVNFGIYLVDDNGKPIKPNGSDASNPGDAVLKDGALSIEVSNDITNTTLTVEEAMEKLGLDEDIYEIVSVGSQVDITSNKATGLHDVQITDDFDPKTTFVGDDTTDKDDLDNVELFDNEVLFAVKLKNRGSADTVVVDYGLPVDIDVLANDGFGKDSILVGYQAAVGYGSAVTVPNASSNPMDSIVASISDDYANVTVNGILSRWQAKNMLFSDYYQYAYCAQDSVTGHHYWSSVTVIPATSIYYEDSFVSFNEGDLVTEGWSWANWSTSGEAIDGPQNQDRPGSQGIDLDADKIYGSDDAYITTETFSGAARWTQVTPTSPARASFTFTGTGFDVVSLTGKTTGTVMVFIYDAATFEKFDDPSTVAFDGSRPQQVLLVNTFYSMEDDLYQVPVIKCTDLPYGNYVVELLVAYDEWFNEGQYGEDEKFDFYLDSVRIYNPAGIVSDGDDNTIYDAYTQDGERWPRYQELRNMILAPQVVDGKADSTEDISGMLFIDNYKLTGEKITFSNYKSWGPNNEVYLNTDDAVYFKLNTTKYLNKAFNDSDDVALTDVDRVHLAMRALKGASKVMITSGTESVEYVLSANDQYFDITAFANKNVTISVTGENPVSITNIKVTHTAMPGDYLAELGQPVARRMMMSKSINLNAPSMAWLVTVNGAEANELLDELNKDVAPESVITPMYASLSFKDLIHCNIYFQAEGFAAEDLGLAVFAGNEADGTVDTASYVIAGAKTANGMFKVSTNGIPAKNLGDTIYFKIFARQADGSYSYTKLLPYSPLDYANFLLDSGSDMDKTLAAAMLNYGAEAQKYFGYNTDTLMNANVSQEAKALLAGYSIDDLAAVNVADPAKMGAFVANGGFKEIYPSVSFKGAFSINYYFRPANAVDGDVTFYYWTEDTYNSVTELTADNADSMAVLTANSGLYRAVSGQIVAKGLDQTVYAAAVYESEGVTYCSGVLAYSVAEYTRAFANGTDSFAPFANATAVYGSVAKAYFCN